ncbi:MAG: diaminopimelate decarboxylase [Chromatiales bacterium]|nr:diaminopimelate decarboxylase [Chromatiales bacterium]
MKEHHCLHLVQQQMYCEDVALAKIAEQCGTPTYIYSKAAIEKNWCDLSTAFKHQRYQIHYAVKACSNIAILYMLARLGSGFDVVSGGELERVRRSGGDISKTVFSGVGKQQWEIEAALRGGIGCINIESESELLLIEKVASYLNIVAAVAIRVNPDIDAQTHPYIATGLHHNKFGVDAQQAIELYQKIRRSPFLQEHGIACHIGSQIMSPEPYAKALQQLVAIADQLCKDGLQITHIDIGGGFGIRYQDETPPTISDYATVVNDIIADCPYRLILEPGRFIVGNAGVLLTQVIHLKQTYQKYFAVVDAAMNDLLRPSLYEAWHDIVAVKAHKGECRDYDIVGPVCESADVLGYQRRLALYPGDLLAILSAGAYGFSMSGNYNTRTKPAEVLVDGDNFHIIRCRESSLDMIEMECIPWENNDLCKE